eukprot:139941-Rhodomonas_salina.1
MYAAGVQVPAMHRHIRAEIGAFATLLQTESALLSKGNAGIDTDAPGTSSAKSVNTELETHTDALNRGLVAAKARPTEMHSHTDAFGLEAYTDAPSVLQSARGCAREAGGEHACASVTHLFVWRAHGCQRGADGEADAAVPGHRNTRVQAFLKCMTCSLRADVPGHGGASARNP